MLYLENCPLQTPTQNTKYSQISKVINALDIQNANRTQKIHISTISTMSLAVEVTTDFTEHH